MKKSKILLLFSLIFLIFLSTTNVFASENVKIKSIDLVDKSADAIEKSDATYDDLTMNFDLIFNELNDYAKYKIVVENNESKDYEISVDSSFNNSKYITYEYEKTDSLKANSESEFYVTVRYKNEVNSNDLVSGKYKENNRAVLKLSNEKITNPLTSNNEVIIIIGLIVISSTLFILFKNKKSRKISVFVLFGLLSIPLFVKAVNYLKITVNSNVMIEKGYSVYYELDSYIKASEMDKYDLTYVGCGGIAYAGSVSEENKYILCGGLYKDDKLYEAGETVNVDLKSIKVYYYLTADCERIGEDDDGYTIDVCSKNPGVTSAIENYYDYDIESIKYFGFRYNDDDNVVMQFTDADDEWQSRGKFHIGQGTTFKMPKHDVVFTYTNDPI